MDFKKDFTSNKYLNKYTNKYTLTLLAVIILAGLGYAVYYAFQHSDSSNSKKGLDFSYLDDKDEAKTGDVRFLDSDNDGVYDWEEGLWGLDPNNPDSDGDGVPDNRYLQQKKREIDQKLLAESGNLQNLTETQKIGRSLYRALSAFENQQDSLNDGTRDAISNNVEDYISTIPLEDKTYLKDDIVSVENTSANSQKYKKEMTAFFEKYPLYTSEFSLIFEASKDPIENKDKLYITIQKYEKYLNDLSAISAPRAIKQRHLKLLNSVAQLKGILSNLHSEEPDDVVIFSSLTQIEQILNGMIETNLLIEKYFEIIDDKSLFQKNQVNY